MDSSRESLIHAGDFKLEELTITSPNTGETADITAFMLEINLYEDLFSFCMSGNLIVADAINLITNLPILGNEFITIKLRTPTLEDNAANIIKKTFQIYAIYDRVLNDDRSQYYNISFMSIEGYQDQTTVVKKSFKGTTDEVARKIYEDTIEIDRPLVIMDTPHTSTVKYTSNHWSPFKNMNFIAKRSKGNKLLGSDYLFFETNKAFYFASLEALIANQLASGVFDEYVLERNGAKMPRRLSDTLKYVGNAMPNKMTVIENLKMLTTLDVMAGNNRGAFASSVDGYDLYTKKVIQRSIDFVQSMKDFKKTGPVNILPSSLKRNPLSNKTYFSHNSALHNDFGLTDEEDVPAGATLEAFAQKELRRKLYLNSFENNKFEATLPGRTDIQVGHVISLLYPSAEAPGDDLTTILDPLLSGMYIISAIHHKINSDRHVMTAELIKNGYSDIPAKAELALDKESENVP